MASNCTPLYHVALLSNLSPPIGLKDFDLTSMSPGSCSRSLSSSGSIPAPEGS